MLLVLTGLHPSLALSSRLKAAIGSTLTLTIEQSTAVEAKSGDQAIKFQMRPGKITAFK